MNINKFTIFTLPIAGLILSATAHAAPHDKPGIILDYDLNADDKLSMEEFTQARRARFDKTDTDNNGIVDEDEYVYEYEGRLQTKLTDAREAQVQQTHVRFDAVNENEDAHISREEFDASGQRGFYYLDQDKDGVILASDSNPVRESRGSDEEQQPLRRQFSIGMPTTHSVEGMHEIYDVNGDEKVTHEEYLSVRSEQFKRADENNDGLVGKQEYVYEFEDRLDTRIAEVHEGQIKQTYVRFGVLDDDENGAMTFKEFMFSGHRSFNRWDTDGDGYVTLDDPAPAPRQSSSNQDDASSEDKDDEDTLASKN